MTADARWTVTVYCTACDWRKMSDKYPNVDVVDNLEDFLEGHIKQAHPEDTVEKLATELLRFIVTDPGTRDVAYARARTLG